MKGRLSGRRGRFSRLLALTVAVVWAVVGSPAAPASADGGPATGLNGVWSCTVPAGYTYDGVQSALGQCGSSGFATIYHLRTPANLIWACRVPAGMTFDSVQSNLGQCSTSGFATSYRLRTPANGLWACTVPFGWTFDSTQSNLGQCSTSGFATSYRLRG